MNITDSVDKDSSGYIDHKIGVFGHPSPVVSSLLATILLPYQLSKEPSKQNLLTYQRPLKRPRNVICTQPPYNYRDQWEIL